MTGMTVDDVLGDAQPCRLAQEIAAPTDPADLDAIVVRRRPNSGVVEGHLGGWINRRVRSAARRVVQLVYVAAPLVGQ